MKDLKGKGQREASVKEGADQLKGLVLTAREDVMGNPELDIQGFRRRSWFNPREPTLGVLLPAFIFFLFNIVKNFKDTEKVKEFYTDSPHAHHLDRTINTFIMLK